MPEASICRRNWSSDPFSPTRRDRLFCPVSAVTETEFVSEPTAVGFTTPFTVNVTLPPGALVNTAGEPISGAVDVSLTPLDVTGAAGAAAFPGRFEGLTPSGTASPIVSYGTAEFWVSQGGQRLQLAPGKAASVDIPVYAGTALDGAALRATGMNGLTPSAYWQ